MKPQLVFLAIKVWGQQGVKEQMCGPCPAASAVWLRNHHLPMQLQPLV